MIKKILFAVLVCLSLSLSSVYAKSFDVEYFLQEGKKAYNQGNFIRATFYYSKAMLINPERSDIFFNSAKNWLSLGDVQQALNDIDECLRLNPKNLDFICSKIYLQALSGDFDEAMLQINQHIKEQPQNSAFYLVRGLIFEQNEIFDKAIVDYDMAIKLHGKIPEKNRQDSLEVFSSLTNLYAIDKDGGALHLYKAMAKSKSGNFSSAKRDFKKAVNINKLLTGKVPEGIV